MNTTLLLVGCGKMGGAMLDGWLARGLDPDRVVYLGSVSKTLAPALRMGWSVAPPALDASSGACATR